MAKQKAAMHRLFDRRTSEVPCSGPLFAFITARGAVNKTVYLQQGQHIVHVSQHKIQAKVAGRCSNGTAMTVGARTCSLRVCCAESSARVPVAEYVLLPACDLFLVGARRSCGSPSLVRCRQPTQGTSRW